MTLIEILMGTFILSVGLMGVLSMFPVAIRAVEETSNQITGPGIGRDVAVGLSHGTLDIYADLASDSDDRSGVRVPEILTDAATNTTTPLHFFSSWSEAIAYADINSKGIGTLDDPTFQLPWDLANPEDVGDGRVVTVPWADGYGWTATFLPDYTPVDENTSYRVQIAVWRNYELIPQDEAVKGTFHGRSARDNGVDDDEDGEIDELNETFYVSLNQAVADVDVGDHVRLNDHGVWYQITGIKKNKKGLWLAGMFDPGKDSAQTGYVSFASRFKLVGLFETTVGPDN